MMQWERDLQGIPVLTAGSNAKEFGGDIIEITKEEAATLTGSLEDVLKEKGLEGTVVVCQIASLSTDINIVVRKKPLVKSQSSMKPPKESIWPMETLREKQ